MNEKTDALQIPQPPQRAYTTPGRPETTTVDSFARSLSQAELGSIDEHDGDAQPNVTGGVIVDEPVDASLQLGSRRANSTESRGRGVSGAGVRQRRPKNVRSSSAPAMAQRPAREDSGPPPKITRMQTLAGLLEPKTPVANAPGWRSSLMNTVKHSWLNVLLLCVPISWALHFSNQGPVPVFVVSIIAIVPLAGLLGFATEEIAIRVGETLGGLLNATFGNAVELLIAILALVKGELDVVQSSMIGSILSNCLLVLGMAYFAGGVRTHEQTYGVRAAQVNINMLVLAVTAFVIPVAFHSFVEGDGNETLDTTNNKVLKISHGVAILLLLAYLAYLAFTLWTHAYLYAPPIALDPTADAPMAPMAPSNYPPEGQAPPEGGVFRIPSLPSWGSSSDDGSSDTSSSSSESEEDSHEPKLSCRFAICLLVLVTALTGVTAEWLVSSIEGLVETGGVSEQFVALILLPLVGNAAEHVTAVTVATRNKLDLSMAVAVGSSVQIALFVVPVLILLGWCIDQPLSFYFDEFETLILFVSVIAVAFATNDGKTNWLEGLCLMLIYVLIAVVIFFYDPTGGSLS